MYLTTGTTASTQATQGENRRARCDVSQSKAVAMFVDSQERCCFRHASQAVVTTRLSNKTSGMYSSTSGRAPRANICPVKPA